MIKIELECNTVAEMTETLKSLLNTLTGGTVTQTKHAVDDIAGGKAKENIIKPTPVKPAPAKPAPKPGPKPVPDKPTGLELTGGDEDGERVRPAPYENLCGFGRSAEPAGQSKDERRCCEGASRIHGRHSFPDHGFTAFTGQKYIPAGNVADRFSYRTGRPDSTTGLLCPSRNSSV